MRKYYRLLTLVLFALLAIPSTNAQCYWPPFGLTGTDNNGDITLNWEAPVGPHWLLYGTGESKDAIGLTSGDPFEALIRMTPEDCNAMNGACATKASFLVTGSATLVFKIYNKVGTELQLLQEIPVADYTQNEYSEITFNNPVVFEDGQDLFFGLNVAGYSANVMSCDDTDAVPERGDWAMTGTNLIHLADAGIDANWNIKVYLDNAPEAKIENANVIASHEVTAHNVAEFAVSPSNIVVDQSKFETNPNRNVDSYKVYRNGELFSTEAVTGTTFNATNVPLGKSTWTVTAMYGENESGHCMAIETSLFEGWVDKNNVLLEIATGDWCGYCPGAALAAEDFYANASDKVAIVEYHAAYGDIFETPESVARINYYGASSFPTSIFDGISSYGGGNASQSIYATLKPLYLEEMAKKTPVNVSFENEFDPSTRQLTVDVTAELLGSNIFDDLDVFVSVTESEIDHSWQGQSQLHFVMRKMLPDANGTSVDFAGKATEEVNLTFDVPTDWNEEHLEVVVWVQDKITKTVLDSGYEKFNILPVGVEEVANAQFKVFPNPAENSLNVSSSATISSVNICNINGQVVQQADVNAQETTLNISSLEKGLYIVQINSNNGVKTMKFNKK